MYYSRDSKCRCASIQYIFDDKVDLFTVIGGGDTDKCVKKRTKNLFLFVLFFCLLAEITVILDTLKKLIYISLETNRRILDRAVLEHESIDM